MSRCVMYRSNNTAARLFSRSAFMFCPRAVSQYLLGRNQVHLLSHPRCCVIGRKPTNNITMLIEYEVLIPRVVVVLRCRRERRMHAVVISA